MSNKNRTDFIVLILIIIVLLSGAVLMSGCQVDENVVNQKLIVGKWELEDPGGYDMKWDFTDEGTFTFFDAYGDETFRGWYTLNDGKLELEFSNDSSTGDYVCSFNSNVMTLEGIDYVKVDYFSEV